MPTAPALAGVPPSPPLPLLDRADDAPGQLLDRTMHTESTTPAAGSAGAPGALQERIAAVAELLASYRSDHILGISQLGQLLGDLRLLADAQGLDFFRALDASYFVYLEAKTPA